ncbi:MAG: nucleotidyltransferase family protein [Myxococcales bacterium]|nr:nucleotidyltransferase family protein [Myxococcales bacterium]
MYLADAQSLRLAGRWTRWAWSVWSGAEPDDAPPDTAVVFHADVIARSGLGPLVAKALQRRGDPRVAWLGGIVRDTTVANLMRQADLQPLYAMLTELGLRWCLLKGAASTQRFPDLTALRHMTDIDLLVRATDFARAERLLAGEGWRRVDNLGSYGSLWACESTWQRRRTVLVELDVHRALLHPPLGSGLTEQLLGDIETVRGLPVPSRTTALLHIALHRSKAWQGHAAELLDARMLSNTLSDDEFEQLVVMARRYRLLNALSAVLLATHWWLGEIPLREQWLLQQLPPEHRDRVMRLALLGNKAMPIQTFWPRFLQIYAGMIYSDGFRPEHLAAIVTHGALRSLDTLVPTPPAWLPGKS